MKRIYLSLLLLLTISLSLKASVVEGLIKEESTGKPIFSANVYIEGTTIGASTNFEGKYSFVCEPGVYNVVVSSIAFEDVIIENVEIGNGKTITIDVSLKQSSYSLGTASVRAKANQESAVTQMEERKEDVELTQKIGAAEMSKKGVSNAAEGLTKVAGMSMMGSKYIFVRGMGDRYNNAMLNGLSLASTDPDRKVPALDIFTSDIIQSMSVVKAFSPKYYGDFAGGNIDIITKDYPDEFVLKIGIGSGTNSNLPYNNFFKYDNSTSPFNTDGQSFNASLFGENAVADPTFSSSLNSYSKTAMPKTSFDIVHGNFFKNKKNKDAGFGYFLSASYSNSNSYEEGVYKQVNLQNDVKLDYDYEKWKTSSSLSILANMSYVFNKNNKITFNVIHTDMTNNELRETDGVHFDYSDYIYTRRLTSKQNKLSVFQLSGQNKSDNSRLVLDYAGSVNIGNSNEPDRRQLVYLYTYDETTDSKYYTLNKIDRNDNHRFYSNLDEIEYSGKANLDWIAIEDTTQSEHILMISAGANYKNKTRNFDYRQFNYDVSAFDFNTYFADGLDVSDPDSYLNSEYEEMGEFEIEEVDDAASAYSAGLSIYAGYLMADWNLTNKFKLNFGLRAEYSNQYISYRDQQQPIYLKEETIEGLNLFPSINMKWKLTDKQFVRAAASRTISRPGFKEVAPFEYIEVFAGLRSIGNPDLQNGINYNFDARYEFFPASGELISVSLFAKYLEDPIEKTRLATASGQLQSYQNADKAYLAGVEFELYKYFKDWFPDLMFVRDLGININASYIYSQVYMDSTSTGASTIQTNNNRALQGASPYLLNVDFAYNKYFTKNKDKEAGKLMIGVAYNVFGKRIIAAGIQGMGDVYETPVATMNIIAGWEMPSGLSIKASIKNVLNSEIMEVQEVNGENVALNSYKKGIGFGLGINYKF